MADVRSIDLEISLSLSMTDRCIVDVSHFVSIIESSFISELVFPLQHCRCYSEQCKTNHSKQCFDSDINPLIQYTKNLSSVLT